MLCWISLTKFQRWEIAPESGTRKGGRANGSRTYQLMMKKLQLLPYIPKEIQKPPQPFKGKGKRRAATPPNDDQGSSLPSTPTKKPRRQQANIVDNVRNDPDFRMSDWNQSLQKLWRFSLLLQVPCTGFINSAASSIFFFYFVSCSEKKKRWHPALLHFQIATTFTIVSISFFHCTCCPPSPIPLKSHFQSARCC